MTAQPIDTIAAIFADDDLDVVVMQEGVAVRTIAHDDRTEWLCHAEIAPISEEVSALAIFCRLLAPVRPDELGRAVELANRTNAQELAVGAFEIDPDDRSVVLRTGLAFGREAPPQRALLEHMIFLGFADFARLAPLFKPLLEAE